MSAVIADFLLGYSFKSISKAELAINCSITIFILLCSAVCLFIFLLESYKVKSINDYSSLPSQFVSGVALRLASRNHILGTVVYSDSEKMLSERSNISFPKALTL